MHAVKPDQFRSYARQLLAQSAAFQALAMSLEQEHVADLDCGDTSRLERDIAHVAQFAEDATDGWIRQQTASDRSAWRIPTSLKYLRR